MQNDSLIWYSEDYPLLTKTLSVSPALLAYRVSYISGSLWTPDLPASTSWVLGLQAQATMSDSLGVFSRSRKHAKGRWRIPTQDGGGSGKQTSKGAARPMTLEGLQKSRLRRHFESQLCCPGAESLKSGRWQSAISAEVWLWVFHGHGQNSLLSHPEDFKWTQESCWTWGEREQRVTLLWASSPCPSPPPRARRFVLLFIYAIPETG